MIVLRMTGNHEPRTANRTSQLQGKKADKADGMESASWFRECRMSELEMAQEGLEHAAYGGVPHAKKAAIVIAGLAACLAVCETAAKDAQTAFLTHHVAASNIWAQYQAKSGRRATLDATADILLSLPDASGPAVTKRIADAHADADRMRSEPGKDGME